MITFGTVYYAIGAMLIVIGFISLIFIIIAAILVRSKRALRMQLNLLRDKMKEQPVIYDEIIQLQDSSFPTIDIGKNTAYGSAFGMEGCTTAPM